MLVYGQKFYERYDGEPHMVEILFSYVGGRCYTVTVDGEFYSTAEHRAEAFDEVVDIIRVMNWAPVKPF